jgi:hypothetical protein
VPRLGQGSTATNLQLLQDLGYLVGDAKVEGPGPLGCVQLAAFLTQDTPTMKHTASPLCSDVQKGIDGSPITNKLVPSSSGDRGVRQNCRQTITQGSVKNRLGT